MKFESIGEQLLFTTLRLETLRADGYRGVGTAFIFAQKRGDATVLLLVTNKHVVAEAETGSLLFTLSENGEPALRKQYALQVQDFAQAWKGHPDPEIDVAICPFVPILEHLRSANLQVYFRSVPQELVPSQEDLANLDAFEECVFIGYPNNVWDSVNNLPVARRGLTATHPAVDFDGKPQFLLDASVFPGSSGSPVFLYNVGAFQTKKGGSVTVGTRIMFLGVLASVFFREDEGRLEARPVPTDARDVLITREMIDLGVVFRANTVLEALDHHFPPDAGNDPAPRGAG